MILRTIALCLCGGLLGCASPAGRGTGPGIASGLPPVDTPTSVPAPTQGDASPEVPAWSEPVASEKGTYRIAWRPLALHVPKNEYFELEVEVTRNGELFREGKLLVDAQMPDHGHGMNVSPRAFRKADGRWHVKGMVLHMGGRWVLELGVLTVGAPEKAYFELQLP